MNYELKVVLHQMITAIRPKIIAQDNVVEDQYSVIIIIMLILEQIAFTKVAYIKVVFVIMVNTLVITTIMDCFNTLADFKQTNTKSS